MSDIFREVDEDIRAQEYVRLWKNYGKYVIVGMFAIVLGTAASVAWRNHQNGQRRAAGDKYAAAMALFDAGKYDDAAKSLATIGQEADAGYGLIARLQEGEALVEAGKADEAVKVYDAIAADGHFAKVYRDLASLSAAMQLMDTGDPEKLLGRLDAINTEDNPWRYSAQELLGALALRTGDADTARNLFKALTEDASAPSGIRDRARDLLSAMDSKS